MQIHELPEYSGDPATNDVFPIDTGTHTFKLPFADLGEAIITTVSATISGVSQTVKAAIEALATRMTTVEGKTANLSASGTATTVSGTLGTGGTITANNTSGACDVRAWSSARRIALFATADGLCGLYDNTNDKQILRSGTDQTVAIPHKFVTQPWGSTNVIPPVCTSMTTGYIVNWLQTGGDYLSVSAQWGGSSYGQRSISVPSGSDRRLKTNIKPTEKSGLDLINALDIVQFDWKDGSGHWDFGIIAQDAGKLDKNIPAGEETEKTYLTLNTMYLVDILLKAVQELSAKVEALENER